MNMAFVSLHELHMDRHSFLVAWQRLHILEPLLQEFDDFPANPYKTLRNGSQEIVIKCMDSGHQGCDA